MANNNIEVFNKLHQVSPYHELNYAICIMVSAMSNLKMNCRPNTDCQRELGKLIIVDYVSKIPPKFSFACPYCGCKLDPSKIQLFKKSEVVDEGKKEETKATKPLITRAALTILCSCDYCFLV